MAISCSQNDVIRSISAKLHPTRPAVIVCVFNSQTSHPSINSVPYWNAEISCSWSIFQYLLVLVHWDGCYLSIRPSTHPPRKEFYSLTFHHRSVCKLNVPKLFLNSGSAGRLKLGFGWMPEPLFFNKNRKLHILNEIGCLFSPYLCALCLTLLIICTQVTKHNNPNDNYSRIPIQLASGTKLCDWSGGIG